MRVEAAHFGHKAAVHTPLRDNSVVESESKVCRSCRGRGVDRFEFDCRTCLGEGTVDE